MKYLKQIYLLLLEQAIIYNSILAQTVDLDFSTTQCIKQHEWKNITYSSSVNGFFPHGCTIAVQCQYSDPWPKTFAGNLTITLENEQLNKAIIVTNSSKRALEVLITNLTVTDFHQKKITCKIGRKIGRERTLEVGYPPVQPENLTVEYLPGSYIYLWLDPVKIGKDLNYKDTVWVVHYDWSRGKKWCSNSTATSRTRHLACEVNLRNITDNGFYSSEFGGNVSNNITFMVNVFNKFVNKTVNSSVNRSFYLPHFVKPDPVKPELVEAGDSWLSISVSLSNVTHDHCKLMKSGHQDASLRLEYTVHKASEAEEHRLRPERKYFREEFGFYRNLPDDERALVTLNGTSNFPQTKVRKWNCKNQTLHVNITGLAPYSHYNITFNLLGKYRGLGNSLNNVMTKESEPLQSPLFGISPYSCFSGEHDSLSCVIYFDEIPRILRRARFTNYILEGFGLTDGLQIIRPECGNFTLKADGQNNSILVENLIHGCVYNISLTAETSLKKKSPSATYTLNASDIGKEVEVEVVADKLNKSHTSYMMFWNNASWAQTGNVKYYIHYCYTGTKSTQSYVCMNNLVTQQENSTWSSSKMLVENYLKPTFFISAVQNGKTSGMIKEKWRYCMHKVPEKVKSLAVRSMPVDSTQLEVVFERADTDPDDCKGRPVYFVISWKECSSGCKPYQDSNNSLTVNAYHKGPFILNGLTDSTDYCVWVMAVGSDNKNSSWTCKVAMTGKSNTRVIIVAVILVGVFIFSLGCVVLTSFYWRRSKAKIKAMHVAWPKPNTKQPLLYNKPGSAFPFFTKIPARPTHVLSGDSGIEDGGVDGIYSRSMLTESGDNKQFCTQATMVNSHAHLCRKELSLCSGSVHGSHLHIEQEDSQSRSIRRYQLIGLKPADSSSVCDDNDETKDREEEEQLSDSELSSELNNSSHHSFNDGSFLSYSENILSRLPKALFQPSGQRLHERNSDTVHCTLGMPCPDESEDDNNR